MTISFLLHKYRLNCWLIRCLLNHIEWVDLIRCDLDQHESSRNLCDSKLQNFCAQLFNFKIIFALSIFEKIVAIKIFTFTFHFSMPWQSPIGDIRRPYCGVKYVEATLPDPSNLWTWASDGSRWVHSNFFIHISPKINTHFITTFLTPKGKVPITVSLYINFSAWLISMHSDLFAQPMHYFSWDISTL